MNSKAVKFITTFMGVIAVLVTIMVICSFIKARKFQSYDTVSAKIVYAGDMDYSITSRKRSNGSKTKKYRRRYNLDVYQTLEVEYNYEGETYTKKLKKIFLGGGTYNSREEAEEKARDMESKLYREGESIDVYTNGSDAMAVSEANSSGSAIVLVIAVFVDAIIAIVIILLRKKFVRV